MASQDRNTQPHAGHQLATLTDAVVAAHGQLAAAAVAATGRAVAAAENARATRAQLRQARLVAIEQRNKHAASHPVDHAAG